MIVVANLGNTVVPAPPQGVRNAIVLIGRSYPDRWIVHVSKDYTVANAETRDVKRAIVPLGAWSPIPMTANASWASTVKLVVKLAVLSVTIPTGRHPRTPTLVPAFLDPIAQPATIPGALSVQLAIYQ